MTPYPFILMIFENEYDFFGYSHCFVFKPISGQFSLSIPTENGFLMFSGGIERKHWPEMG